MRVAQLIESMDMGGAERLAVQIANARAAAGDQSHLVVMTGPGPMSARIHPSVRTHYLGYSRASLGEPLAFSFSVIKGYRLLSGLVRRERIEVVHAHLPEANFWGLCLAVRGDCAAIATVHNNEEFRYGKADHPLRARLRRWGYRKMLGQCAAVVAVSAEVRASLASELSVGPDDAERLVVIPNGVEIPAPLSAELQAQARAHFGIPVGDPLVLAAGRLSEQKNFVTLLEAIAQLRVKGLLCRVVIAGDGPQRAYLDRRVEELGLGDQVVLPGNVQNLQELMQSADLFVLPSLWEGLPLVLLEAMAAGLPVVGSRIKGIAEIVEDGVSGILVEPGDAGELARGVSDLLGSAPRRAAFGAAGLEIVRREYDFARVSRQLGALYGKSALRG
jgi:glycosyltransferase involved in cell wall biosynthesis